MADILNPAVWSETDGANTSTNPLPGWPEGMLAQTVNNAMRASQGAVTRFAHQINATVATAGTGGAYTVSYNVAPEALYNGQRFCVLAHAACLATPTLNINSTGAKVIKKMSASGVIAVAANDITVNMILDLVYITALNQFLWINPPGTAATSGGGGGTTTPVAISDVTGLQAALDAKASIAALAAAVTTEFPNAQTASYTLVATDAGKIVTFNSASAVVCTINASVFPVNSRVDFLQLGAGQVSFAGSATKRVYPSGASKIVGQYAGATAWFVSATEYALIGNVVV